MSDRAPDVGGRSTRKKSRNAGKAPKAVRKKKACPKCGSLEVVRIMYGYPMPEAMEAADRGEIELGGCCVSERDPQKYCKACGERFDFPPTRPGRHVRRRG